MQPKSLSIPLIICLALLLGSCSLPARYAPTSPEQNLAYTAAAQTIVAQLTDIANPTIASPTTRTTPGTAAPEASNESPVETLPNTSTPLPTKTPLPSDTPTITPTPSPSATPTPTSSPTQPPADPKARLGEPTWKDTFKNGSNWVLYNDNHVSMDVQDNQLMMTALKADKYDAWMLTNPPGNLTNFYLEVTVTPGECSGLDRYGLLARSTVAANQAYLFGFSCDGEYSLRIWNSVSYTMLVEWTASPFILKGADQTNRLGILIEGKKLSLYANGNLLTQLEDETFSHGAIGLFVGAVKTPRFTVAISEVAYWEQP
jgi:hypothetical protein